VTDTQPPSQPATWT